MLVKTLKKIQTENIPDIENDKLSASIISNDNSDEYDSSQKKKIEAMNKEKLKEEKAR